MSQAQTRHSIKNAKSPKEVFTELVAQITVDNAVVTLGSFSGSIEITQEGNSFPAAGKMVQRCRTNRFLPSIVEGVRALGKTMFSMSVEDAKKAAYAVKDENCVNINVWSDDKLAGKLLARRPFSGKVDSREYESVDKVTGEVTIKTEFFFSSVAMDDIIKTGKTLSASDFCLEDPSAMAEDAAIEAELAAAQAAAAAKAGTLTPAQLKAAEKLAAAKAMIEAEVGN